MNPNAHRGFISIEVAVVLFIVLLAAVVGLPRYSQYIQELEWKTDSRQLTDVAAAAKSYIRDNRDTLVSQVSGGTPVYRTGAQLRDDGYLPAGFSLTNSAAQSFRVAVARNPKATQKLIAFILTQEGTEIPYKGLRYIAQGVEGAGGYIYTAGIAEGAWGSWKMTLATYGLTGATGRLAVYLSSEVLGTDVAESDRLYRYAVNGRPDLNRMHTSIDMGENNINNGGTLNAKNGVFSDTVHGTTGTFSGDISGRNGSFTQKITANSDITSDGGWLVTTGNKGWMSSTHGGGFYMDDNNWVKSLNGKGIFTSGQLKGGTVHADGRLTTNDVIGLNKISVENTACPTVGDISRDKTGVILSCQEGIWKTSSSTGEFGGMFTLGSADLWNYHRKNYGEVKNEKGFSYYASRECDPNTLTNSCSCPSDDYTLYISSTYSIDDAGCANCAGSKSRNTVFTCIK